MDFIERNKMMLLPYKYNIYMYQKLSEEFMRKHKDQLDWSLISQYQSLSPTFVEEMKDYVDWTWISIRQQKLTKDFILRHIDKLNIYSLLKRGINLPKEIKNCDYVRIYNYYIENNSLRKGVG